MFNSQGVTVQITNAAGFAALVGPTLSVAETKSMGGLSAQYEAEFETYADLHWQGDAANWEQTNYYDRAFIYYEWYARTADATYLARANAIAEDYLNNYIVPNDYTPATWWSMPKGIAAHYLINGDKASLSAVGKIADELFC